MVRKCINVVLVLALAGMCIGLSGCVTAQQKMMDEGYKPLTTGELTALFSGTRNAKWVGNDGTQMVTWASGSTDGTYSIKDGTFCSKINIPGRGERCSVFFKIDENKYKLFSVGSGSTAGVLTFE